MKTRTFRIWLCLLLFALLAAASAEARNPDRSFWTVNLSQVAEPEGVTRSDAYLYDLVTEGQTVHALWRANGGAGESYRPNVVYRRSRNIGKSWEPPQVVYAASAQNEVGTAGTTPILGVGGGHVHIVVTRSVPGWHYEVVYIHSGDGGISFDEPRILFTGNDYWVIMDTRIVCQGNAVTVALVHYYTQPDKHQIMVLNSEDAGVTFTPREAVWDPIHTGCLFDLKRNGSNLYLLRYHGTGWSSSYQRYLGVAVSNDLGVSFNTHWLTTPAVDGNYWGYGSQDSDYYQPHLAMSGTSVYALWAQNDIYGYPGYDDPNGRAIYVARSRDYGKTFGTPVKVSEGVAGAQLATGLETVAARGRYVYVLFPTRDGRVMLALSTSYGWSFESPKDITLGTGGWWAQLAIDSSDKTGATAHVVAGINYLVTRNGGQTFTTPLQAFPYDFTWERPKLALGPKQAAIIAGAGFFYDSELCGGLCDRDIFARVLTPAPTTGITGRGLRITTATAAFESRRDNMQVADSPWLNFKRAMTAELWVRPMTLGATTGTTSASTPFLFKELAFSNYGTVWNFSYAVSTMDNYGNRLLGAEIRTMDGYFPILANPAKAWSFLHYNIWAHLAMTYDADVPKDNLRLYRNGRLVAVGTATGEITAGTGNLFVGKYGDMFVDEVRLWDRALTQQEITDNMDKPLTGSESGLAAYYAFEKTTRDLTGHGNDGILMYLERFMTGRW